MLWQSQDVGGVVDRLAAKLAVPVSHLWDVLVRQARAETFVAALDVVFGVALLCVTWKLNRRAMAWAATLSDDEKDIPACVVWLATSIFAVYAAVLICGSAENIIRYALNPEGYALSRVLSLIGK